MYGVCGQATLLALITCTSREQLIVFINNSLHMLNDFWLCEKSLSICKEVNMFTISKLNLIQPTMIVLRFVTLEFWGSFCLRHRSSCTNNIFVVILSFHWLVFVWWRDPRSKNPIVNKKVTCQYYDIITTPWRISYRDLPMVLKHTLQNH